MKNSAFFVLFLLGLVCEVRLLENGLARTPPMGWMSWGYYRCNVDCAANPRTCLDEGLIMGVADEFYEEGYQEAGYEYIIIDDCWSEKRRENGKLVADRKRFPHGMKFLADYIHSKGLKFGMYLNLAEVTCMGIYPGSRGHLREDAQSLAEWDIDYLKVDGCFNEVDYLNEAYVELGRELQRTTRNIVYSCSWPYYLNFIHHVQANFTAIMETCNLWRNYEDINLPGNWPHVEQIIRYFELSQYWLSKYHGPGHWNDPDMLLVATGNLTLSQSRVQMAVYAMMSMPLIISCDMNNISKEEKKLLLNSDLLAIDQDPLGVMALPVTIYDDAILFVKNHLPIKENIYPTFSFALVNFGKSKENTVLVPRAYGLHNHDGYTVLDVFTGQFTIKNITPDATFVLNAPAEDVVLYTFYPL